MALRDEVRRLEHSVEEMLVVPQSVANCHMDTYRHSQLARRRVVSGVRKTTRCESIPYLPLITLDVTNEVL
jgi:hypothetical protein